MSSRSLYNQPRIKHPLLYGEAGGRIKKPIDYVRHYQPKLRSILEAGDLIMITDQTGNVEFYMVDPRTKPMYIPHRKKCLATKWSTGIPQLVGNQNPGRNPIDATEFNVALGEIALWKIYATTGNFQFDVEQPANTPVFTTGVQPVHMSYGNTVTRLMRGDWGGVPELCTFEEKTPVTINVTPTNMNEVTYIAYVGFEGYRYRLIKTEVPNPADEPRVVVTLQLSALI